MNQDGGNDLPRVALTLGDPCGVGPEIVARALQDPLVSASCRPVLFGHPQGLARGAAAVGLEPETCLAWLDPSCLEVGAFPGEDLPPWGAVDSRSGWAAYRAVELAVQAARAGRVEALATAPIHKEAWGLAGITHSGHTEALQHLTGAAAPDTFFQLEGLRIFFLTRHLSLARALKAVRREAVTALVMRMDRYLRAFGVEKPRLAVAALNPHAGEGGRMGREEQTSLRPAVEELRAMGLAVEGPVPADAVFHLGFSGRYDAVLSLYHDQGHIAAKTRDFFGTISVTAGLPFPRTSVDHGTAMDLAGTGRADARSMVDAVVAAAGYARRWPARPF